MNAPEEGREVASMSVLSPSARGYRGNGKSYKHIVEAERAIGRSLPHGAVVHHVDLNPRNNAHSNLAVCPSQKYHKLIHIRTLAIDACGNPQFRRCRYCKQYDDPKSMFQYDNKDGTTIHYHRECHSAANSAAYRKKVALKTTQEVCT